MTELTITTEGQAGRITLQRPKALNALTYDMILQIEAALIKWQTDPDVTLILIDAEGDRAFCAGGDISKLYKTGQEGQYDFARTFWRDEYRMNLRISDYPKPVVSFLQGFTMGGGVGLGCHASHRIVCENSRIAMPECGIGLLPDVGGTYLLAQAPGKIGTYLGVTGAQMSAQDALFAGFADHFVEIDQWEQLKAKLIETGDVSAISAAAQSPAPSDLQKHQAEIDAAFSADSIADILQALENTEIPLLQKAQKALQKNAPLAMACTLATLNGPTSPQSVKQALEQEFRFVHRALEHSDFLEGIRAAIIDRDGAPNWKHTIATLPSQDVTFMLGSLGNEALDLTGD